MDSQRVKDLQYSSLLAFRTNAILRYTNIIGWTTEQNNPRNKSSKIKCVDTKPIFAS